MNRLLLICCLCVLTATSCSKSKNRHAGSENTISQSREVSDFSSIYFNGYGNLYLTQGSTESLKIEGEGTEVGLITTNVLDGVLHIDFKKSETGQSTNISEPVNIHVQVKSLQEIRLSGSGSIFGLTPLNVQTLKLSISGSGSADIRVVGHRLFTVLSGSGNFVIKGVIENQDIWISGSGIYRAEELSSRVANINITGAGKVFVNVQDDLDVRISGAGSVIYQGTPRIHQSVSGAGTIEPATPSQPK